TRADAAPSHWMPSCPFPVDAFIHGSARRTPNASRPGPVVTSPRDGRFGARLTRLRMGPVRMPDVSGTRTDRHGGPIPRTGPRPRANPQSPYGPAPVPFPPRTPRSGPSTAPTVPYRHAHPMTSACPARMRLDRPAATSYDSGEFSRAIVRLAPP